MTAVSALWHLPFWPRTLGSRLFLILLAGLAVAHALSFTVLFFERYMSAKAVMLSTFQRDVATATAILDRLPAAERPSWLGLLDRGTYRFVLGPGLAGSPELTGRGPELAANIREAVDERFPLRVEAIPQDGKRLQAHITMSDGSPLTIDIRPQIMPLADWLPYVLLVQLAMLVLCSWAAVRLAIRPLVALASAAEALDPSGQTPRLSETGPREIAHAATAFNAMRDRIAHYLDERVQILAAISHDLQTPITRMKLRAEMAEDSPEKEKLVQDLSEIERLVREGVTYARSAHGKSEKPSRIDVGSFIESLAYDYQDTGKNVSVTQKMAGTIVTRPHALRRILTNLVDNALKYGGDAEISTDLDSGGRLVIKVLDRGPGIPDSQLNAVLQPFFRLEHSRSRETGGTGLGLAIAHQHALAISSTLVLCNREGGGLSAELRMGTVTDQLSSEALTMHLCGLQR